MKKNNYLIILTGTDPESRMGGIGFALPGYIQALKCAKIKYISIPTYRPNSFYGKYCLFIFSIPRIIIQILKSKINGNTPIIYSHVGSSISLFREGCIVFVARAFLSKTIMQIHCPEIIRYLKNPIQKKLVGLSFLAVNYLFVLTPWWKNYFI